MTTYNLKKRAEDGIIVITFITMLALAVIGALSIVVPLESIIELSIGLTIFKYICLFFDLVFIIVGAYTIIKSN